MTLLTVVRDVCATVGVTLPTSVFGSINTDRTMQEMLALANEVAQRIAYDTRDWVALRNLFLAEGDGIAYSFPLPNSFKRITLSGNVRRGDMPTMPLRFENDFDRWCEKFLTGDFQQPGEWLISGGATPGAGPELFVRPTVPAGVLVSVPYIQNLCVILSSGGYGERFVDDNDRYRLDERLLKLGMIWQWKAQKGAPYAEDMGSFSDALALAMGKDAPAPTLVGRLPMSHGTVQSMSVTAPSSWPLDNWP